MFSTSHPLEEYKLSPLLEIKSSFVISLHGCEERLKFHVPLTSLKELQVPIGILMSHVRTFHGCDGGNLMVA